MNGSSKGWINHERRKEVKNREREEEKGKRKASSAGKGRVLYV